jgi:acetyl esterase/lipase
MVSWIFLGVSIVGALFTLNAYVPQRRTGPLVIPSFFAGWLTTELPLHHIAWQLAATFGFAMAGAFDAWPGELGLGICVLSWLGLIFVLPTAEKAKRIFEAALQAGLGPAYASVIDKASAPSALAVAPPPRLPLNPFHFAHPEVATHRGIEYVEGGGERNSLDVYAPRTGAKDAPVLLQIHGGGWVCVSANYRLSPRATFPDHLIDLKRAIAWIREHVREYGGNPDFVAVTGGSAGGHLCSLVALTANDPEYQPGFEDVDTRVRAAVPFYGVYDFSNTYKLQVGIGIDQFVGRAVMKKSLRAEPEAFRRASPMHRIHEDAPPFFIIHGSADSLAAVEEARHFAQLLRGTSRAPVVYAELPGTQHAFELFHSVRTSHTVQAVDRFLTWAYAGYLDERR